MDGEFQQGMKVRRAVVGSEYVQAATPTDGFNAPFQQVMCEAVWGKIWTRDGLALRDRSLVVVAILIAQGRSRELGLHLRGAVRNGCTVVELREVVIQSLGYCGAPAAVEAMKVANEVLQQEIEALSIS